MRDPGAFAVGDDATVREAMRAIDQGRIGLALVVDGAGQVSGTVTDGDVRRAILREISLDSPVRLIMAADYVSAPVGASREVKLGLMEKHKIQQLPVLAPNGRLLGVETLADLVAASTRENWVVIMAGGKGSRLRPLTSGTPKPMLPVGGKPLLEITVRRLVDAGLRHLFLAVNYRGEQIEEHFGDGRRFGCQIAYLHEDVPLDTGGALSLLPSQPNDPVLVHNGDLMTDVDYAALLNYHVENDAAVTLCVKEMMQEVPYGVVNCEGDAVLGLEEKPSQRLLINAGIYVLRPDVLERLPKREPYTLPQLVSDVLASGDPVSAFPVHEQWIDIGQLRDYERIRDGEG